jgi:predicted TIM-barrel fold metal-dependent hydrolase
MSSQQIHDTLSHPVIDSDAHWLAFGPLLKERIAKIGGRKVADCFKGYTDLIGEPLRMTPEERRFKRVAHMGFWQVPMANTIDRATAMMPSLLYERMDELGLDFCVMYPTDGPSAGADDALRCAATRAFNTFSAELFADFSDRLTPVALIPTNHPEEAIAELEYVTGELGMKATLFSAMIPREVPSVEDGGDAGAARQGPWYDTLALDSAHDYDPVWQKCVDLGIAPTFHSSGRGYVLRRSPSNFTYNHIGHFASAGEAICKSLFLGGVTRRFPTLNFAFLEGGSHYACQLLADLIGHWHVRNPEGLKLLDPANLDHEALIELGRKYGPPGMAELLVDRESALYASMAPEVSQGTGNEPDLDDFAACEIESEQDFKMLFGNFYFGCEADDRMNASAFNTKVNPLGARINALFSSDIGHFDVRHMNEVLEEAHELVDDGVMSKEDFRDFTFANPVDFWSRGNPAFFEGTAVERQVADLIDARAAAAQAAD